MLQQIIKDFDLMRHKAEDKLLGHRHSNNSIPILIIGLAVGAIIGILLAPKKGLDTQADVQEGWDKLVGKTKDAIHNGEDEVKRKAQHIPEVA